MRKVLFLCVLLGLFSMNNAIASESGNVPMEMTSGASDNLARYWATNIHYDEGSGNESYFCFTINWEYTGNYSPEIAFMVYVYDSYGFLETSFQDSAYGIAVGSRDYKIKVQNNRLYRVHVEGWEGNITR